MGHFREFGRFTRASGRVPIPAVEAEEADGFFGASLLESFESHATHLEAVLSLKTMQVEHLMLFDLLMRESNPNPVVDDELEDRGAGSEALPFVGLVFSDATAFNFDPPGVGGYFFDTFLAGGEKMNRTLLVARE
jgi:hypothetical protein